MPVITVAMYSGRAQRDKDRLAEAITEDVVNILKVEKKDVIIVFQEASHGNWYASGVRLTKNEIITEFYIAFDNFVYSLVSNTIGKKKSGSFASSLARHGSRVMNG
jgi:4-oxalocrotonate tautomerase